MASQVYAGLAVTAHNDATLCTSTFSNVNATWTSDGPPTVYISSPAGGQQYDYGANVTITAVAQDSDGSIDSVEFFDGVVKLGADLTSPYQWTISGLQRKFYNITAKATDDSADTARSAAVTISAPWRIMPVGNSLTYGGLKGGSSETYLGGYRYYLWDTMKVDNVPVDFVGSLSNGYGDMDRGHDGHSGWIIKNIYDPLVCGAPFDLNPDPSKGGIADNYRSFINAIPKTPDIVLLEIGSNDVTKITDSVPGIAKRYAMLLDTIKALTPQARVFAASFMPVMYNFTSLPCSRFGTLDDSIVAANSRLQDTVDAWHNRGEKVDFVDLYNIPGLRDDVAAGDGIHPTNAGYRKVARKWYESLSAFFAASNPTPAAAFSQPSRAVDENTGTVTVTATLSATHTLDVKVPFAVSGTASNPSDHDLAAVDTITVAAGNLSGSVTFNVVDDGETEEAETVVLTMGTPVNAVAGTPSAHTVTIHASDPHVLTVLVTGSGTVDPVPSGGQYYAATDIELTANPSPGQGLAAWLGGLSGNDNPDTITVDANKTVTAVFEPLWAIDIKQRIRHRLTADTVCSTNGFLTAARSNLKSAVDSYVAKMNSNGSFTDLSYSREPSGTWDIGEHFRRVYMMATAFHAPGQAYFSFDSLRFKIDSALAYANSVSYLTTNAALPSRPGNWWWWWIGAPSYLGPALVLMQYDIDQTVYAASLALYAALISDDVFAALGCGAVQGIATGQNLTALALEYLYLAALRGQTDRIDCASLSVGSVCTVSGGDRIRPDYSFHQHGPTLYTGGYGAEFSRDVSAYMAYTNATSWELAASNRELFLAFVREGVMWAVTRSHFDPSVIDRGVTRPGADASAALSSFLSLGNTPGIDNTAYQRAAAKMLETWSAALPLEDAGNTPRALTATAQLAEGQKHFRHSDYSVHRGARYYASVKMFSDRVRVTDSLINDEGKQSWHVSDGFLYVARTGDEYFSGSTWPALDWQKIPGTTVEQVAHAAGAGYGAGDSSFAGGTSLDSAGAASFVLAANNSDLTASKSWFFFDKEIVCMGSGIECPGANSVFTIIDQRRLSSPSATLYADVLPSGAALPYSGTLTGTQWIACDSMGYYFPAAQNVRAGLAEQSGSWDEIGSSGDTTTHVHPFVTLWYDHGSAVSGGTYCYAVVPGMTASGMGTYVSGHPVTVLEHSDSVHAVKDAGTKTTGVSFFRPGSIDFLQVDTRCILMYRRDGTDFAVALTNPLNTKHDITVTVEGQLTKLSGEGSVTVLPGGLTSTVVFAADSGRTYTCRGTFNTPPSVSAIADQGTPEDTPTPAILFTVGDDETAASALIVSAKSGNQTLVPDANIVLGGSAENRTVTITPSADEHGKATITVGVSDGTLEDTESYLLTVSPENDKPSAVDDTYPPVDEDNTLQAAAPGVLSNDDDIDGDGLTAFLCAGPAHGSCGVNADGSFAYSPSADYAGPDTFTYRVYDGVLYDTAAVALTVAPVNDAPSAGDDAYSVDEDDTLRVLSPGVSDNDSDVDNGSLSVFLCAGPDHGTLSLGSDGSFEYVPSANFHGADTFSYRAHDGAVYDTASVGLAVAPVNDPPSAANDTWPVEEDDTLRVASPGVKGNDVDADGDALTVSLCTNPSHGTLSLAGDGSFDYRPSPDFHGADAFTYRVYDGALYDTATVSMPVSPINDRPSAAGDMYAVDEDDTLRIAAPGVKGNDVDADGDALTVTLCTNTLHGALSLAGDGSFEYRPAVDFSGTDTFTYRVYDGVSYDTAAVSMSIAPANDRPVITSTPVVTATEDSVWRYDVDAVDIDGVVAAYGLAQAPPGMSIDAVSGNITWRPRNDDVGAGNSVIVTATDDSGDVATQRFAVTVVNTNDPPAVDAGPDTMVMAGDAFTRRVSATDPDAGDVLTYALAAAPSGMTIDAAGIISWVPSGEQAGDTVVIVIVRDWALAAARDTFAIRVEAYTAAHESATGGGVPQVSAPCCFLVAPNPAQAGDNEVYFTVTTGVRADGRLRVYSATGDVVFDHDVACDNTPPHDGTCLLCSWDLRDRQGNPVRPGTYLTVVKLRSFHDGSVTVLSKKLGVKSQ